jgi:hypothetical protein
MLRLNRSRMGLAWCRPDAVAFSGPGVETLDNFFEGDDDSDDYRRSLFDRSVDGRLDLTDVVGSHRGTPPEQSTPSIMENDHTPCYQ